ncbi:MAG: DUF5671 domain-containing protein [Patescibacteria group bacterium]
METHHAQKTSLTPKFFFLSAGLLVTLIVSVTSGIILFFESLNIKFPDALTAVYQYGYNSYNYEGMRAALATLIIIFPLFLVISYFWNKESRKNIGYKDATLRKWVIYLVLFLASVVIISDLVTLVRYFVSGEITTRFILKVVGAFVTAGLVGSYYIFGLRSYDKRPKALSRIYGAIGSALIVALIILSFMAMGSPKEQRALRFDDRRVSDLQSIQYQVITYWQQKEKLPSALSDLSTPLSSYSVPRDPEFDKGTGYEYRAIDALSFQLCATFARAMPEGWQEYSKGGGVLSMRDMALSSSSYPGSGINESWDHDRGRTCFTRTIDRDIYPPYPKIPKQ